MPFGARIHVLIVLGDSCFRVLALILLLAFAPRLLFLLVLFLLVISAARRNVYASVDEARWRHGTDAHIESHSTLLFKLSLVLRPHTAAAVTDSVVASRRNTIRSPIRTQIQYGLLLAPKHRQRLPGRILMKTLLIMVAICWIEAELSVADSSIEVEGDRWRIRRYFLPRFGP